MSYSFNPFTGNFDDQGPAPGGTLTNPFPSTGVYWYDTGGALWLITLDVSGAFVATPVGGGTGSTWLSLGMSLMP